MIDVFGNFSSNINHASSVLFSTMVHQPVIASATVACGMLAYYCLNVVKVPELAVKRGSLWHHFLVDNVPLLSQRYWASVWCFEARLQTVMGSVLSFFDPPLKYKREILKLSDGGQLCLDWISENPTSPKTASSSPTTSLSSTSINSSHDSGIGLEFDSSCDDDLGAELVDHSCNDVEYPLGDTPILVVLPGLTGSSESEYVKDFIRKGQKAGYKCVVFNNRGRGGVELKTQRTYCAANCDDFAEAMEQIVARYRRERQTSGLEAGGTRPLIVAIGISLGGMILGHYVSDRSEVAAKRLSAAVGVSVPYNVFIGTESLERPWLNLALNSHLAHCLVQCVVEMKHILQTSNEWDYDLVLKSQTIREFDSRFTAPQFGFSDVNHYYSTASLHDKLDSIKVPFLGISSEDDPFQPRHGLPLETASRSDHVALAVTSRGGHIGFLEGLTGRCWAGRVVGQLLTAILAHGGNLKGFRS